MYTPPYREQYETLFAQLTGKSNKPMSSSILRLYSTLIAMKEYDKLTHEGAYSVVEKEYDGYRYALFPLTPQHFNASFPMLAQQYTQLSLVDFLSYVVPDLVCEPRRLMEYQEKVFARNPIKKPVLIHHILQVKMICYQMFEKSGVANGISPNNSSDDVTKKIYAYYQKEEKVKALEMKEFLQFYTAINFYVLDHNELAPHAVGDEKKYLAKLMELLFVDLQLTRNQAYKMVADFHLRGLQTQSIQKGLKVYNYIKQKDAQTREALIQSALILIAKISPLEIFCAISTWKRQIKRKGTDKSRTKTQMKEVSAISPNDVTLENSLIYSLFFNSIPSQVQDQILIAFPPFHFVRKVLRDRSLNHLRITFLFNNRDVVEALKYQAGQGSYVPRVGKQVTFVEYSDWVRQNDDAKKYAHLLMFGTSLSILEREGVYLELLRNGSENAMFYTLESSNVIGNCPSYLLWQPSIANVRMALIPQGINNSSYPRRKVFFSCSVCNCNHNKGDWLPVAAQITAYTLDTTMKTQALSPMREAPVCIYVQPNQRLQQTLFQIYEREILSRRPPARTRNMSFSTEITPDILVWCSKTYPKHNDGRPRLEAYVCEPMQEDDGATSGVRERGKAIEATKKHTTKIENGNVLDWLENTYPYSVVNRRKNPNAKGDTDTSSTNVRDEIISYYSEHLLDKNIALKTFWYLYPNLSDAYSQSAYKTLSEMMQTSIGHQRLGDFTAEECEYLLVMEYPKLSLNQLWKRFEILSTAIDKAVENGYCVKNDLRIALSQKKRSDKLFAQVRRALVKKHFTKAEMQRAYSFCVDKLANGEHAYLGVLIRLVTGLESSIVCAIRWCDLVYVREYDMYSFVITRQVASDGTITGFDDTADYICFPVPEGLQKTILTYKKITGKGNKTGTIVSDVLPKGKKSSAVTPKILNSCTKEMIVALGIDEKKVVLPDETLGLKETDLNKYHGDFIRENFRYWATHSAKLNADELSYLLRTKATTTLGRFYCDFLNEASQLILRVKLNRWEATLNDGRLCMPRKYTKRARSTYQGTLPANTACRKNVILEITPSCDADISVEIESPYGVHVDMMLMDNGEG